MESQGETELDKAISAFKYFWKEKFDLNEQIDMEKALNEELQKAQFTESEFDFSIDLPLSSNYNWKYNQEKYISKIDFSKPLLKQIEELEFKLSELQAKYFYINDESKQKDDNNSDLLVKKIDNIKEEIKSIDICVNNLLDKIVTFDDDELHELRTKKQHIDLQKKSKQKSYL